MKQILFLLILCISIQSVRSEKIAEGYIINLKNDTISGKIDLQRIKGMSLYKPFNWGMFSLSVTFILKDGQEKEFFPRDIKGFDFEYSDMHYKFRTLKIGTEELQSLFSDDAPSEVFAQMHIEGNPISFYIFRFNSDVFRHFKGKASLNNYYYNYYAKTPSGLVRMNRTFKNNELFTILRDDLKLEESFIETVPKKYRLDEIEEVINSYNAWKKKR